MKEMIKLTYRFDEDAKKSVDEGAFTLHQAQVRGLTFLPEHWNLIVRPWQSVEIRLDSQEGEDYDSFIERGHFGLADRPGIVAASDQLTAGAQPTAVSTKYRIDFYFKSEYQPHATFLHSKSWDAPVVIRSTNPNGDSDHALEEIHHITFGKEKGARQENISELGLILGPDDKVEPKRLHVRSPLLLNALRSVVKYSSTSPSDEDTEPFVDGMFSFPFKELYHHREELLEFQKGSNGARANHTPEDNADCDRHIDILIDYLDNEPTVQLESVKKQWAQKVPATTFAGYWLLMKPGADVYVREYGRLNAYVVDLVYGGMKYDLQSVRAENYRIHVWYLIFNGKVIKRKSKIIEVPVFDGERDIVSLSVFPTSFHDKLDGGRLRRSLIERGEKVFRYARGPNFLEYSGPSLRQGAKKVRVIGFVMQSVSNLEPKYNRARVVVEHQSLPWTLPEFAETNVWDLTSDDDKEQVPRRQHGFPPLPPLPPHLRRTPYMYPEEGGPGSRARVPRCECSRCKLVDSTKGASISPTFSDYDSIDPSQAVTLSEHQALVCMSHMFGFVLKDRTYGMFSDYTVYDARNLALIRSRYTRCERSERANSRGKCN
jgi:hypothetical protein